MKPTTINNHYVDNARFLEALKEHIEKIRVAKLNGDPKPQLSNYIGECILKIANHLSYRPNFIGYTYRDEMVSDGIENCLQYIDNFDPIKSSNPFAYFTQIIYYAFIRRIQREKKQTYIKGKIIMEMPFSIHDVQAHDEDGNFSNAYLDFIQSNSVYDDIVKKEDDRKAAKKKPKTTLEEFLDE